MKPFRLTCLSILSLIAVQSLVSCATDEPKKRERVPPSMAGESTLPWNRPPKWEGNAKYGSMMPGSR